MSRYEFQIGDTVKTVINTSLWYNELKRDIKISDINKIGIIVGVGVEDFGDIDALTYMVLVSLAFYSTIIGRKTIYVIELENGDMMNVYYDNIELVESAMDKRNRIMDELTDILVSIDCELMKTMSKYRIDKISKLNKAKIHILSELADDEMIKCAKYNSQLILQQKGL